MTDALKRAVEEADGKCPCKLGQGAYCCVAEHNNKDCCKCEVIAGATEPDVEQPCKWPGHAAIRKVARVGQEGMREEIAVYFDGLGEPDIASAIRFVIGAAPPSQKDMEHAKTIRSSRALPVEESDG